MGKVFHFKNCFPVLVSRYCILANTYSLHAHWPDITPPLYPQAAWPYEDMLGSILKEDALPPPVFLSRYVIYLCHHLTQPTGLASLRGTGSMSFYGNAAGTAGGGGLVHSQRSRTTLPINLCLCTTSKTWVLDENPILRDPGKYLPQNRFSIKLKKFFKSQKSIIFAEI